MEELKQEIKNKYESKYAPAYKFINQNFQEQKRASIDEYRNTLQNMLIVSAAIASFSLPLVNSTIGLYKYLLVIGISTLIINTMIVFSYLISKQSVSAKKLKKLEREYLLPMGTFREKYIKLMKDEISIEDYLQEEKQSIQYFKNNIPEKFQEESTDNSDVIFITIFILGISSVVLGMILPLV